MKLLSQAKDVLAQAGFAAHPNLTGDADSFAFENNTILGFAICFEEPSELISDWRIRAEQILKRRQFQLRAAGSKSWNLYLVLLAEADGQESQFVELNLIEEDLQGMRKIARCGLADVNLVREALLSILPVQSSPILEAIDMKSEIQTRTSEVSESIVDAYLSKAEIAMVLQHIEDQS
ncbi:MAG: hypothetical protein GY789_27050 [Hyphomicrobiales bacterium]|nr:hypothetical protein [Hyphomicrobiales bacterium]